VRERIEKNRSRGGRGSKKESIKNKWEKERETVREGE
jgi:hypothetical protein